MREDIKKFIGEVEKPGRYTGNETGSLFKDKSKVDLRIAFCFPDTYEIGMSNLGMRILCGVLNEIENVWCERVYAPWVDMEEKMKENGIPLYTHESGDPISEFGIVAFTMQYELCYTNVLNMMKMGNIPLLSSERDETSPIIIAGGPCAYNSEPMAAFVDIFSIGEGEEALPELAKLYLRMKKDGTYTKKAFLKAAACELDGFYVPSLYKVTYNGDGTIAAITPDDGVPSKITKRIISDVDKAYYPLCPVIPYIETVQDRINIEVYRGCIRGCRFCQAGFVSRPVREKSPEVLTYQAKKMSEFSGYEEISLSSLSISDYSRIGTLTDELVRWTDREKISLTLPSLRADSFTKELMTKISSVRSSTVTFAPEAGSQRLRDVINKNVNEEDILNAAGVAYEAGKNKIKLYFMNGLPYEEDEDIKGIARLSKRVIERYYETPGRNRKTSPQVTLSVACFIPKPHTPFQWEGQNTFEELERKQELLLNSITDRKIKYNYHDAKISFLEAVFARGDRRLSEALLEASRRGVRFDSWEEHFDFDNWMDIFDKCGIDPAFYANRTIGEDEILPWEMIDTGVTKSFLKKEHQLAKEASTTPSCKDKCSGCGANRLVEAKYCRWCPGHPGDDIIEKIADDNPKEVLFGDDLLKKRREENPKPVRSIRVRFEKSGSALYISHLDLSRAVGRSLMKSKVPVWFTEGFNPIPHMVFSPPLSLGQGGQREILDFRITEDLDDEKILQMLKDNFPEGIIPVEVYTAETKLKEIGWALNEIRIVNPETERLSDKEKLLRDLSAMFDSPVIITKKSKKGEREVDISQMVYSLNPSTDGDDIVIEVISSLKEESYLNPSYIFTAIERKFGLAGETGYPVIVRKDFLFEDAFTSFR